MFALIIVMLSAKIRTFYNVTRVLGNIAYEFYLVQGLVLFVLDKVKIMKADIIFAIITLSLTLVLAAVLNKLDLLIITRVKVTNHEICEVE